MDNERDSSNLIAFVAMLLAAVGFKDTLQSIYLYGTGINLLNILAVAALLFGTILYFQLLNESYLSLQNAMVAKQKQVTGIVIKGVYFSGLVLLLALPVIIMIINGVIDIIHALDQSVWDSKEITLGVVSIIVAFIAGSAVSYQGVKIDRRYRKFRNGYSEEEIALVTKLYTAEANKAFALRSGAGQRYAKEVTDIEKQLAQIHKNKRKNKA